MCRFVSGSELFTFICVVLFLFYAVLSSVVVVVEKTVVLDYMKNENCFYLPT